MARDEATERQVLAARPDRSTWLAANAGSGKTRVLTDRVARLLLEDVKPEHILCLTYTKAAASEMQNRLFRRLGDWAMRSDRDLAASLEELGIGRTITSAELAQARTLFARAIETPGGLKIQTIHSFCASILRRFPLEAGVSPQFTEMEDRSAELLRAEIVDDFSQGVNSHLVDGIARFLTDTSFENITSTLAAKRDLFGKPFDRERLARTLGLPRDFDENALRDQVFLEDDAELLARFKEASKKGSKADIARAAKLEEIKSPDIGDLPMLESIFLYGEKVTSQTPFSAKIDAVPTKKAQSAIPELMPALNELMQRIEEARPMRLALAALEKSAALSEFASAFLPEYARRKQLRGWLDFDDLILKTRQLLNDPSVAQWVLYRLDGGINHILVDEAQDTSPDQWDVIEKLAQEFTSGIGARSNKPRTIFVVGDKKQSIYSFQGADPNEFDRMQSEFSQKLDGMESGLQDLTLEYSFRSSEAILKIVDLVFESQIEAGFAKESVHRAFKSNLPGRVDLWPVVEKVENDPEQDWTDPLDRPSPRHHTVMLAENIASTIRKLIEDGETIPVDGGNGEIRKRAVQAGDFLVLVQRRSELFSEIIRACKAEGLPIAGADRLKVGAEMAVKDLAALLSFLATPEDSLSLATALRSPLFGWTEQQLFDLAHRREAKYLWKALRDRGSEFPDTLRVLLDLRNQTDFLRPYDLIERILTRHAGRKNLLARLGTEAEDGINALLAQALSYERAETPSLTGFLVWMETDDLEIKRQMGSAGNLVRVMTVHGAKGLEAPIVILPDTGARKSPGADTVMDIENTPFWSMKLDEMPTLMAETHALSIDRQMFERMRLLYVALTRAEKWLIVAVAGDLGSKGDTWYEMVEAGLRKAAAKPHEFELGEGLRFEHLNWSAPEFIAEKSTEQVTESLPDYVFKPAPALFSEEAVLSPSDLGGAKALPGDDGLDEEEAKLRGSRVHILLEHLPTHAQSAWNEAAFRLLPGLSDSEIRPLLAEARGVLNDAGLASVFSDSSLSEVPVTAEIFGKRFHGIVDRLIIEDDRVLAVDFKTNATVPEKPDQCPEGLLRQMGAYDEMLRVIYPDRRIDTAILWTRTANLMTLPHDLVSEALKRAPSLDADAGATYVPTPNSH